LKEKRKRERKRERERERERGAEMKLQLANGKCSTNVVIGESSKYVLLGFIIFHLAEENTR